MKRLLAGVAAGCAMWPVAVAEAHKVVAPNRCGIKAAQTELVTDEGVQAVSKSGYQEIYRFYACRRVSTRSSRHRHGFRKRRFLGEVDCMESCDYEIAVTRGYPYDRVAFTHGGCSRYFPTDCPVTVRVVALSSGRSASTGLRNDRAGIAYLDITRTGTAVWMDFPANEEMRRIRGLTLDGETLSFDEAPDLNDMALSRSFPRATLFWKNAGEVKSAEVP